MISKKPLISTTLAIFISIYLMTAIIAILDKRPADSFIYGILETIALIIGCGGMGFFAILALITFTRKKVTDSLYTGKSNKRFSVDKGELFTGRSYAQETVNPENDLPEILRNWLNNKSDNDQYREVFLKLTGILKAHRELTFNNSSIYANNCKITETMLLLNNGLNPDLIILIGFTHNLGRVEVAEEGNYSRIADKSRNILANTNEAWKLSEIRELLFIISNYVNDSKRINCNLKDNQLDPKLILPYIELLNNTYSQDGLVFMVSKTTQMKLSDYDADQGSQQSAKLADKVEAVITNTEPEAMIAPQQIIIPTPKSKTKKIIREPEQQRLNWLEEDKPMQQQPKLDRVKPDIGIKLDQLKI